MRLIKLKHFSRRPPEEYYIHHISIKNSVFKNNSLTVMLIRTALQFVYYNSILKNKSKSS